VNEKALKVDALKVLDELHVNEKALKSAITEGAVLAPLSIPY